MAIETFLLAGGVAALLGVLAARMMRVLGLALLLVVIVVAGIGRVWLALPHPSLVESLVLLVLIQAGYLLGVLTLGAPDAEMPAESILSPAVKDKGTAQ